MYILFFRKNQKNASQKEVRDLTFDFIVEFWVSLYILHKTS